MSKSKYIMLAIVLLQVFGASAQQLVTLNNAIAIALEKNHSIKISKNDITIAENKATWGNAGLLPDLDINASGNLASLDSKVEMTGGLPTEEMDGAKSNSLFASLDLSYTIFDGFKNRYKLESLRATQFEKELNYTARIEKTIIDVINAYYNLINIQANLENDKETYNYSVNRYNDVANEVKYGQNTELELLTAKGYINTDSSRVLNTQLLFQKAVLDLNNVLGVDTLTGSEIFDNSITLTKNISKEELQEKTLSNNIDLKIANSSLLQSEIDIKSNKYFYMPKISLNASYGYGNQEYEVGAMLLNRTVGPSIGFTVRHNVFAGDRKRKDLQNAKIAYANQQFSLEETKLFLNADFEKAWLNYQYYLTLIPIEQNNVEIAEKRFKKTQSQYKLGQASNLEFRDAQLNLRKTNSILNETKINAKLAEWELLRMAGLIAN